MRILLRDLTPGTQYAVQFRSNSGDSVSEWSRVFYLVTGSDLIAPNKPTNVVGSMAGTSFKLSWDAVTTSTDGSTASDLDRYEVQVTSAGSGASNTYVTKDTKFEFSLEMNAMLFGNPRAGITMAVRSVDKAGNTDGFTSAVTQTNPAPAIPANFSGASGQYLLTFKWDPVADLDLKQYRIYSGTTAGTQATLVWSGVTTGTTIQTTDTATDRWYKVVSVDVFGTESGNSTIVGPLKPTSPVGTDSTAPNVPTGLSASLANSSDESYAIATVSWTAVTDTDNDLSEYIIGYRPVGATDWQYAKVDYTNTSTKINGLLPYTNYEFRIRSSDFSANLSAWSATVTATASSNTAPSTPTAPTVSSSTMRIQVTIPGTKAAGGAMEADVTHYEVYASTTTGFTPAAANQIGRMIAGPAMVDTFQIPTTGGASTQTWYVKIIAVDRGGLKSSASAQATSTPGLIDSANIVDLAVTNAKINNLDANKIVAGTGFINDITVKSKFTLGDGSTTGAIESFGYVAGTTGFRLDKNTFEVNGGSISAAALRLQDSDNILPVAFADFEMNATYYATNLLTVANTTRSIASGSARFGSQFLQFRSTSAAAFDAYLGVSATDYNINVEPSSNYILSAWIKTGTVASTVTLKLKLSNGTILTAVTQALGASGSWQRISGTVAIPAGITTAVAIVGCTTATTGAGFDVDGIQVERQNTGSTTPSPWTPPSFTQMDGGIIRTGEMRSNTNTTVNGVSQPNWSINMSGGAQFGDARIRGTLVVGAGGADVDAGQSFIASGNYVSNTTGWKIDSAGNAEFNSGKIKGDLLVGGTVTSDKFAVGLMATNLVRDPSLEESYALTTWNSTSDYGNVLQWRKRTQAGSAWADKNLGGLARSGKGAIVASAPLFGGSDVISNSFPITPGKTYRVSLYALQIDGQSMLDLNVMGGTTAENVNDDVDKITRIGDTNPPYTVTQKELVSNVAKLTIGAHDILVNDRIKIDIGDPVFDGWAFVNSVTATTVEWNKTNANITATATTGNVTKMLEPPLINPQLSVTNKVLTSNIATLTVSQVHSVDVGQYITVSSVDATFNGTYVVTDVGHSPETISYAKVAGDVASTAASGTIQEYVNYPTTPAIDPTLYQKFSWTFTAPVGKTWAALRIMSTLPTIGQNRMVIDDVAVMEVGVGGGTSISAAGVLLYGDDGTETGAFVSNRPSTISIQSPDKGTVAAINDDGTGLFSSLRSTGEIYMAGQPLGGLYGRTGDFDYFEQGTRDFDINPVGVLENFGKGMVASTEFAGTSFGTTIPDGGEVGLYQLDATLEPGRSYVFGVSNFLVTAATNNSRIGLIVRYATGGTTPNLSSNILFYHYGYRAATGTSTVGLGGTRRFTNNTNSPITVSFLVCVNAGGTTGSVYSAQTLGAYLIDTGITRNTDSGTVRNLTSGTPTASTKTYTSTWKATSSESYGNFGARSEADLYHGYYSANQGDQFAHILFNGGAISGQTGTSLATALSGATIKKVEVYLKNNHTYNASGMTVRIRQSTATSLSGTANGSTSKSFSWARGAGAWVDITSICTTSLRSISLGKAASTSLAYYGYFSNHSSSYPPQLRVTYTK